jgi:hypothetical protein
MKLTIRNYAPIIIPAVDLVPLQGQFKGETPYAAKLAQRLRMPSYRLDKLPAKLLCLESLARTAEKMGGWGSFAEPMAGVGLSARILGGKRKLILSDFDAGCRHALAANFKVTPGATDIFKGAAPAADMVFLDFNDFTYKRGCGIYEPVLQKTFLATRKFVIINDCTIFYFRYGAGSYKSYSKRLRTPIKDFAGYFKAVRADYAKRYGWTLVHVAYFQDSSFQLFTKTAKPLVIEAIKSEPIVEVA